MADGKLADAAFRLGQLRGFGISRISKVVALADQDRFGIYDSRSAHGLSDLLDGQGNRIVPIPPGRVVRGDTRSKRDFCTAFANYTGLLRLLHTFAQAEYGTIFPRVADIEMALFMRSRSGCVKTGLTQSEDPPHHLRPLAEHDEESTYWTCGPENKRTAFRVLFDEGSTTVFTGKNFSTGLTLTDKQVDVCMSEFRDQDCFPLSNSKTNDDRDKSGLGEYFRVRRRKSPLFASHFASLWVTQGRLKVVAKSPLMFRVVSRG